jgi:hypothetical protein
MWLRLMGGAVWWMRDGERRAGEVFNTSGVGGSLENHLQRAGSEQEHQRQICEQSQHQLQTCNDRPRPAIGSPTPAAETGSRTVVDLESAPVHPGDPAARRVIRRACRTRLLASNTPPPSTQ